MVNSTRLLLVIPPNNVWAELCEVNVYGECILVDVSGQVSRWGEFQLDKLNDLSQHCTMMVVIASKVSCHTAVVENM